MTTTPKQDTNQEFNDINHLRMAALSKVIRGITIIGMAGVVSYIGITHFNAEMYGHYTRHSQVVSGLTSELDTTTQALTDTTQTLEETQLTLEACTATEQSRSTQLSVLQTTNNVLTKENVELVSKVAVLETKASNNYVAEVRSTSEYTTKIALLEKDVSVLTEKNTDLQLQLAQKPKEVTVTKVVEKPVEVTVTKVVEKPVEVIKYINKTKVIEKPVEVEVVRYKTKVVRETTEVHIQDLYPTIDVFAIGAWLTHHDTQGSFMYIRGHSGMFYTLNRKGEPYWLMYGTSVDESTPYERIIVDGTTYLNTANKTSRALLNALKQGKYAIAYPSDYNIKYNSHTPVVISLRGFSKAYARL